MNNNTSNTSITWFKSLNGGIQKYIIDIVYNLYNNIHKNNNNNNNDNNYNNEIEKLNLKKITDNQYHIKHDNKNGILILSNITNHKIKQLIIENKYDFCITSNQPTNVCNIELFNEYGVTKYIIHIGNTDSISNKIHLTLCFLDILYKSNIKISYNSIKSLSQIKTNILDNVTLIDNLIDNIELDINTKTFSGDVKNSKEFKDTDSEFSSVSLSNINDSDIQKIIMDTNMLLKKKSQT